MFLIYFDVYIIDYLIFIFMLLEKITLLIDVMINLFIFEMVILQSLNYEYYLI
jgi:hypothetical protein